MVLDSLFFHDIAIWSYNNIFEQFKIITVFIKNIGKFILHENLWSWHNGKIFCNFLKYFMNFKLLKLIFLKVNFSKILQKFLKFITSFLNNSN